MSEENQDEGCVAAVLVALFGGLDTYEKLAEMWRNDELTSEKKNRLRSELDIARGTAVILKTPHYSHLGLWGFVMTNPRRIATAVTEKTRQLTGAPSLSDREIFTDWIELLVLNSVTTPEHLAWVAACVHLLLALDDPAVQANPVTVALLESALLEAQIAHHGLEEAELFSDIKWRAAKAAVSKNKSEIAKAKNKAVREWVQQEWKNRPDAGQSKASFARQHVPLIRRKFPEAPPLTPETIARYWLKGR